MSSAAAPDTLARAASGYRATLLSHGARLLCKITGVVVLARVVSPADHGVFAMAASVTFLLTLFRDFGTSAAAVQAPVLTEGQMTALQRLQIGLGVLLGGMALLLAPLAAAFFHEPRLIPLLAVMSASFPLIGASSWPRTLLSRELRFDALNSVETAGAVVGTGAMIVAGVLGAGAYAFAVFLLVSETVMLAMAWRRCRWRASERPDWRGVRALHATGLPLTAYNVLLYGLQQADTLLLGRWFGAAALGPYNRAGQLLVQPVTHLAAPFSQVLLSTLSRLGPASPAFAVHFLSTTRAIAYFTLPVAAVCLALPREVVRVVLGARWPEAAPLLAWLSVSAAVSCVTATGYALCVATGNSRRLVHLTAVALPVTLLALGLGRAHGPVGLAAGLAAANVVMLLPRLAWMAHGTPVRLRDYVRALTGPVGTAAALATGLFAGRVLAGDGSLLVRLLAAGIGGLATSAACARMWPRVRGEFRELWQHLPFRRGQPVACAQTGDTT